MGGDYNLVPGVSVGDFVLGESLWRILDVLRASKIRYPKVEISWNTENAVKSAVTIHLPHLTLYFPSSLHQILTLITIPDVPSAQFVISYETTILHSPTSGSRSPSPLNRGKLGKVFGPTYAGSSSGKVTYPGISFELTGNGAREDVVSSLTVTSRSQETAPLNPLSSVTINPGEGVTINTTDTPDPFPVILGETTSQDLLLDLGPPLRKFYKEDNRLQRMWGMTSNDQGSCFWNYFQYGLDFLVDSEGRIAKVICYSNIPGTPLFQRHARCPWKISTAAGELDYTSSLSSFRSAFGQANEKSSPSYPHEPHPPTPVESQPKAPNGGGKKKKRGPSPQNLDSGSEAVEKSTQMLNGTKGHAGSSAGLEGQEKGMVLDRVVEGGFDGVEGLGPSRLVEYDGIIVEEDTESGGITSILVCKTDGRRSADAE